MIKEEDEDSVIVNEDLFEQVSDEEQIIQNEEKDEECSFFSNKSNKNSKVNKNKVKSKNRNDMGNNMNNQDKIINIKNININNGINNINNYDFKIENNIIIEESSDINSNNFNTYSNNNNLTNNNNNNENYENNNDNDNENNFQYKENIYTKVNIAKNNNKNHGNNKTANLKKFIYKKQKINKGKDKEKDKIIPNISDKINENVINTKDNKNNKKQIKLPLIKKNNNSNEKEKNKKIEKDKKSFIKKMKDKTFNYERNNFIKKTNISYDKFGNKNFSKNKDSKDNKNNKEKKDYKNRMNYISNYKEKNNYKKISPKNIKLSKKANRSYNNTNHLAHHEKSKSNLSYKSSSPKNFSKNIKKINLTNAKISQDITNKSSLISGNSSSVFTQAQDKKKIEHDTNVLKKILINKINNQISDVIRGREKMYFNDNNNLFFLGFCDIMFELGFLHIKETEISDITQIDKHIKDLYTQPYTNRALLSESFLYNEQHLLICAWKTILNNFNLIKDFDELPQEKEEITLDDCKLFIFIITGLFLGFNSNKISNDNSSNNNTDRKVMNRNKSLNNFNLSSKIRKEKDSMEKNLSNDKLSQSYTKNKSSSILGKKIKYQFRKKSGNNTVNNKYDNNNFDENILKTILDRKKSNYNYKSILKIKNYFTYFAELRKLFNLYQKDLKNYTKKVKVEKDLTFYPKTNKNNIKLINKFAPSLNFFERSALIKNRNDQKKIIIQRERSEKMMKECTFEPGKKNHKINKLPLRNIKEISNRLYLNNSYRKQKSEITSKQNSSHRITEDLNSSKNGINKKGIYSKELIRSNKVKKFNYTNYNSNKNKNNGDMLNLKESTSSAFSKVHTDNTNYTSKSKKIFNFAPNINRNFNREMFSHSPLHNDNLVSKRIKNLRESNFKRILNNYEKNNREIISNEVKNNKQLLKKLILAENKQMRMDNEKRTNKDTFENFINYDILYDNNIYDNQMNSNNEPLFTVEIKIKDSIKTIEVYQGDAPENLAYDFCVDNFLGKASFEKIVTIIKAKLEEINSMNFNDEINTDNKNEQNEEILENKNDNENYENYEEEDDENHIENIKNDNIYAINENIENNIEENDKDDKNNEINFNDLNQNNFNEVINDNSIKDKKYSDNNILEHEDNNINNYNDNNIQEKFSSNINNNSANIEEDNYERINEEDEINDDYQIDNNIQSFNNINNFEEINEVKESEISDNSNNDIINK